MQWVPALRRSAEEAPRRVRDKKPHASLPIGNAGVLLATMNYRHAFHAGSFADVIKHIVLVRILSYLHEKPAAFRVIDSHAGAGLYDLEGDEARRSGEWLTGIARIMQARFSEAAAPLIKQISDSSTDVGSYWLTAWINAGKPALPR